MECIDKACMVKEGMTKITMSKEDMPPSKGDKSGELKGDSLKGDGLKEAAIKSYYAYILRCSDGTLYSGYTNNLTRRLANHNKGRGAKYTRSRLPVQLAYYEELMGKRAAMRREAELKRLTRAQNEALIDGKK